MKTTTYVVCSDCLFPIVYGDFTGLDQYYPPDEADARRQAVEFGITQLVSAHPNGYLTIGDADLGFSNSPCECCGSRLAGDRFEALVIHD